MFILSLLLCRNLEQPCKEGIKKSRSIASQLASSQHQFPSLSVKYYSLLIKYVMCARGPKGVFLSRSLLVDYISSSA